MKPKPRSATIFLMVPVAMWPSNAFRTPGLWRTVRSKRGFDHAERRHTVRRDLNGITRNRGHRQRPVADPRRCATRLHRRRPSIGWRTFRVDRMRPGMSGGARFMARRLTDAEAEARVARG